MTTRRVYETPFAGGRVEYLDLPLRIADIVENVRQAGCRVRTSVCDPFAEGGPPEPHLALDGVTVNIEPILLEAGFKEKCAGSWYWCVYGAARKEHERKV